jgi:hypothetical protein
MPTITSYTTNCNLTATSAAMLQASHIAAPGRNNWPA